MTLFTQGNWVDCGDTTVGVEDEDGTIKCWICECEPDYVYIEEENARANARLIANAPEMYRLLSKVLGLLPPKHDKLIDQIAEILNSIVDY